jgi:hypothetical protein
MLCGLYNLFGFLSDVTIPGKVTLKEKIESKVDQANQTARG